MELQVKYRLLLPDCRALWQGLDGGVRFAEAKLENRTRLAT